MGQKIEYWADKGLVVVTQSGDMRYSSALEAVPGVARLMEQHHTHLAVIDLRRATLQLSVPEVYFVTKQMTAEGVLPGSRVAFVCPRSETHAELYDFCALAARNRGYRTRHLETVQAAEDWLREGQRLDSEDSAEPA